MIDWEEKNKAEWNYYHRDEGKPTFSSGTKSSRWKFAGSEKRSFGFVISGLLAIIFGIAGLDAWLAGQHFPIISEIIYYSCHTQAYQMVSVWEHTQMGNILVPHYEYQNICGTTIKNPFYYLVGAQLATLFTCWFGLIPFLISYIKEKSIEKSFSELKLLPLHKQWIFLVCVGLLGIVWSLFWIEYFLR